MLPYVFDNMGSMEKFSIRCHNPLNLGLKETLSYLPGLLSCLILCWTGCVLLESKGRCVESGWIKIGTAPLPSPVKGEGRGFRSNFFEEIRPKDVQAFIVGVRIKQPRSRRDTAQERIAVLWGEAKARDLMPIAHGERRD